MMGRDGATATRAVMVAAALLGGAGASILVRWTVRDTIPALAGIYYATPLIVAAAAAGLATLSLVRVRWARAAAVSGAFSILLAAFWLGSIRYDAPCEPSDGGMGVLFWNVARGAAGWDRVAEEIRELDPDVAGFVEAAALGQAVEPARFGLSEGQVFAGPGAIVIFSRWPISGGRDHDLGMGRAASACIERPEGALQVVVVDLYNLPLGGRRETIKRLSEVLDGLPPLPTMVMGDFNTPIDATAFEPLRRRFVHAFEIAGRGLLVTWPSPMPVLALDHLWVSGELGVRCARHGFTLRSDHVQVLATVHGGRGVVGCGRGALPTTWRPTG